MRYRNSGGIIQPGINTTLAPNISGYTYYLNTWGYNGFTNLGLGNSTYYSSPKQVGSLTDWLIISSSYGSVYGIKTDKTLWTWGRNNRGQLGLGNITYYSSPKQVGSYTNWANVTGNSNGVTATKTDGTLWAWGYNQYGILGLGNTTYAISSPTQVGALTNWGTPTSGYYAMYNIKTDGTLWAWGGPQSYTQLGLGNGTMYSSPKQVGALTNWSIVTGGIWHAAGVRTDGTLWVWGRNLNGELGLGISNNNYSSPTQVGALTNWLKVAAAGYSTFGLKTNGTLWSWGYNVFGQLGLNNRTYYSSPKQVGALTNWSKLPRDPGNTLGGTAIKTDGTLWAWGYNQYGQLGTGNTTHYSSPKQVGSLTTWYDVTLSRTFRVALLY